LVSRVAADLVTVGLDEAHRRDERRQRRVSIVQRCLQ